MVAGVEKVATLMLMLTQENAAKIFGLLEEDEIKLISQEMRKLGTISTEIINRLIEEFFSHMSDPTLLIGNLHNTERFLFNVLGKERAKSILHETHSDSQQNIWYTLGNVSDEVLANYIKNEYPQTAALILSKLPPHQAASILVLLDQEFAFDVITRMVVMDPIKKEVLDKVETTLRSEFVSTLSKAPKINHHQLVAEIFNNLDHTHETLFMAKLEQYNLASADRIKKLMFTFDDLLRLDPYGIQMLIKVSDKTTLAIALKGAPDKIRKLFMTNMSQRATKILVEDIENIGPIKLRDVDTAQAEIINAAKKLIASGEIELPQHRSTRSA